MLYEYIDVTARSPNDETNFFDITAGVLQGDTLTRFQFIICHDNVLGTWIDLMKENSYHTKVFFSKTCTGKKKNPIFEEKGWSVSFYEVLTTTYCFSI